MITILFLLALVLAPVLALGYWLGQCLALLWLMR